MKTIQTPFDTLNPAQLEAVTHIEGPVMVMAGPGTGKTHVLAARIAYILQTTDTPPHAILALTFTESAAVNMRERVVSMIGKEGYYVQIMTFHSFCMDVIKSYPEYFPLDRSSEALSDLEKYDIFQTLIQRTSLKALKPVKTPLFYIKDIIQAISHLKREGISPDSYAHLVQQEFAGVDEDDSLNKTQRERLVKQREKNKELSTLYVAYQQELTKRIRYDFDDMISFVVSAFKNHSLLLREYQERLLYFLIDEYQDTNTSQNTVAELLASYWGDNANICVVGDPHQSIYRFQGASIENTLHFVEKFSKAAIVTLDTGYRGTQSIYDASYSVIQNNQLTQETHLPKLQDALSKPLKSIGLQGDPVIVAQLPSETLELIYVAEEIKKIYSSKVPYENIAILYRHNADAGEIQRVLEKWGIPYEIEGGEDILEAEMIRQLLCLLRVIEDIRTGSEDEKLFEIMAYQWTDINPVLAMKIAQAAGKGKMTITELVAKGYDTFLKLYGRDDVTPIEFHDAEIFVQHLQQWAVEDAYYVFTEWFERVIQQSGYLKHLLTQENRIELLTNINSLFREIKALVSEQKSMKLSQFLAAIYTMQDHHIGISAEDLNIQKGVVHLSTVHRAKGREWEYVFVINCIDGKWGNVRSYDMIPLPQGLLHNTDLSKKERNEDERRLFYVALTRAKKQVYITSSRTRTSGHHSRALIPCMFIEEIDEKLRKHVEPDVSSDQATMHIQTLLQPPSSPLVKVSDRAYFAQLVRAFRLSVTGLNTYLRSTDEFIQNVLLKVPRSKPAPMAFGSAVHYAFELRNKSLQQGDSYSKADFIKAFEEAIERETLRDEVLTSYREHGTDVLGKYYDMYADEQSKPLFVERFFGSGLRKAVLGDIQLTGRLDRVDLLDPEARLVRVIDYKTGRPRTLGEIDGTTVSAQLSDREHELPDSIRGPYKRQLLFYKLLAELDTTFNYTVEEGVFDFVEPDSASGKFVRRHCALPAQDVEDLKTLIQEVMDEIRSLNFLS